MKDAIGIDHVTLCVKNLAATRFLFTQILGFHVIWAAQDVGSDKSSMDTVVVQRGEAKIALMQGRNKEQKSQICEFVEKYGEGVQHIALEVDDIDAVCREWEAHGVRFSGDIKDGRDGFGPLRQRFTYPPLPRMRPVPGIDPTAARSRGIQNVRTRHRRGVVSRHRAGSTQRHHTNDRRL